MTSPLKFKHFTEIFFLLLIAGGMSGCSKYSSPRKIERLITQGNWKLSSAYIDTVDLTSEYSEYQFQFSQSGTITVIGDPTISGKWETGVEKNPTYLSLTITPFYPFYHLNADWTLTECTRDRLVMELVGGSSDDVLVLDKL